MSAITGKKMVFMSDMIAVMQCMNTGKVDLIICICSVKLVYLYGM